MSRWRQVTAAALVGALLGAAGSQAASSSRLAAADRTRREALETAARLRLDLVDLRRQVAAISQLPGGGVILAVHLETDGAAPAPPDVAAALGQETAALLGTSLDNAAPDLIWRLFNGRLVSVRGQWFRVTVRLMVLAPVTHIVVDLRPVSGRRSRLP